ncbi:MAG TPA: hypothetical protein PL182_06575 [Pseudobdellovibrionaceae bacterium]|nr:hypothetical protein [Pseudobdellovibrionaceae bacterium]
MKKLYILFLIAILSSCALNKIIETNRLQEVKAGMSMSQTLEIMGDPNNFITRGEETIWFWDEAIAVFERERVVHTALSSMDDMYVFKIDSLMGSRPPQKKALILPVSKKIPPLSLEFQRVSTIVSNMIKKRNYNTVPVSSPKNADVIILVDYGVSEPTQDTSVWSEPVLTYQQPQQSTTNLYDSFGMKVGSAQSQYGNSGWVYSGERIKSSTVTTYKTHFSLEAVASKPYLENGEIQPFWKVQGQYISSQGNYRLILPYMAIALTQFIEAESDGPSTAVVFDADPRVKYLTRTSHRIPANNRK